MLFLYLIKPNMTRNYITVKFYIDVEQTCLPFIKVGIDDTRSVIMLVDSGSQDCMIFDYLFREAKELFIKTEDSTLMHGIGGCTETPYVVGKLHIAGREFLSQFSVASSEVGQSLGETVGFPVGGLIGTKFMLEYGWIIDYSKQAILIPES